MTENDEVPAETTQEPFSKKTLTVEPSSSKVVRDYKLIGRPISSIQSQEPSTTEVVRESTEIEGGRESHARIRRVSYWGLAVVALIILIVLSLGWGRYSLSPLGLVRAAVAVFVPTPASWHLSAAQETVLMQVRIPRIFAAVVVGAALSGSGSAYQSMFRNPLVAPDILGVSAGAGFGASLAILLNFPFSVIQLMAFVGGLIGVTLSIGIAQFVGRGSTVVLVLAGLVVSALAQALISMTQYFSDPETTLPRITFWLLGGLDSVTASSLWLPTILVAVCVVILYAISWPITVLAAGEDEARSLGIDRRLVWGLVLTATTLMTATVVSVAGIIGWVGLVVPHLARSIVGPSFHRLLLASLLIGAGFLLAVDDLGRSASSIELPLGVLTAVIGAPFFVALLAKARHQWL
ncbi:MAG: iron ABC transporter permease [Pseudonocardiales bacterium]|nr:iron ABC transporter permease [Pseudonocardiales bacterium]